MRKALLVLALTTFGVLSMSSCQAEPTVEENVTYTVTFNVDGVKTDKTVEEGEKVAAIEEPKKDGYTFTGWYTSADCKEEDKFSFDTAITSNLTLYAGFEKVEEEVKTFTVTLELNGGTLDGETSFEITEGELVTKPTDPTKNGYTFDFWASDKELTTEFDFETTIITRDITLYAKFELVPVEVKYNIEVTSEAGVEYRIDYAADGNTETYWKAQDGSAQTLTLDLGGTKSVNYISQEFVDMASWNFTISGSIDGTTYVPLLDNSEATVGSKFERNLTGYYRYIKMDIAESDIVATSKEFEVEFTELNEGINLAYGQKGVADCHSGGFEPEKMFDGNTGNYHCCNQPHDNHYMGMDTNEDYYVDNIELYFPNETDHKFNVDYASVANGGQWIQKEELNLLNNTEEFNYIKLEINDLVSSLLVHYNQTNSANAWPAMSEMKVNGFKLNKDVKVTDSVMDLGSQSYLSRIYIGEASGLTFETSLDNKNFEAVTPTIENGYAVFNKECRYVKVTGTADLSTFKVYSASFIHNLALNTKPTASTRSEDSGFWENMMVMNKDCKQAQGRFWCALAGDTKETINLDLGINVLANDIFYKYQDPGANYNYQLKIYVSKDNQEFINVLDTTANENGGSNEQSYTALLEGEEQTFRYLKIETYNKGGFTNCNTLEIHGIGSPII